MNYCFKFGNYTIPNTYIAESGYKCKPQQRQDLEPWTDADGLTHRNVVVHRKSDVTITFRQLKWNDFVSLMEGITSNYLSVDEKDAICTYINQESNTLSSGHFYLDPSCEFSIKQLNGKMDSFSLRFTEY